MVIKKIRYECEICHQEYKEERTAMECESRPIIDPFPLGTIKKCRFTISCVPSDNTSIEREIRLKGPQRIEHVWLGEEGKEIYLFFYSHILSRQRGTHRTPQYMSGWMFNEKEPVQCLEDYYGVMKEDATLETLRWKDTTSVDEYGIEHGRWSPVVTLDNLTDDEFKLLIPRLSKKYRPDINDYKFGYDFPKKSEKEIRKYLWEAREKGLKQLP